MDPKDMGSQAGQNGKSAQHWAESPNACYDYEVVDTQDHSLLLAL